MMSNRTHYVYRAYDDQDRLIYVGCTGNITSRYQQHKGAKVDWLPYATRFRLEGPYEKAAGFEREAHVIESERPYFNAISAHKAISVQRTALRRRLLKQLHRDRPDLIELTAADVIRCEAELGELFGAIDKKVDATFPSRESDWRLQNYLQARNQEVAA